MLPLTSCFVKGYLVAMATFSLAYFSLTAVDVFAASIELKVTSESDGHIIGRLQDNPCRRYSDLCSLLPLPAGGK